jgi:hypothetical protein
MSVYNKPTWHHIPEDGILQMKTSWISGCNSSDYQEFHFLGYNTMQSAEYQEEHVTLRAATC